MEITAAILLAIALLSVSGVSVAGRLYEGTSADSHL
jgi:hypothetical protein